MPYQYIILQRQNMLLYKFSETGKIIESAILNSSELIILIKILIILSGNSFKCTYFERCIKASPSSANLQKISKILLGGSATASCLLTNRFPSANILFASLINRLCAFLRDIALYSVYYIDDILLFENNYENSRPNKEISLNILPKQGFVISFEKRSERSEKLNLI